jgi:PhnB protein
MRLEIILHRLTQELTEGKTSNRAIPYLSVLDAKSALEFYAKAFGAKEVSERIPWEGRVGHAEFEIEGARIMLADEFPEYNKSPKTLGGTPVSIHVNVKDVDATFENATKAGAKVLQPLKNEPYGRICKLEDPFGHVWFFNTASSD